MQAENVAEMKEVQKNMQGTSNDALKFYFALDTELENIKNEAQAVANNKSLNDKTKADRLETLQTKFDFIQGKQDIFRDKKLLAMSGQLIVVLLQIKKMLTK